MLSAIKMTLGFIYKSINYTILIICAIFNKKIYKNKSDNKMSNDTETKQNKKIMILVSKICKGGAERAAINVAENLSKKYEVVIVMPQIDDDFKEIEQYKCNVKCIEIKGSSKVKITRNIKKFKKENGITHCISFGTKVNFINVITKGKEKVIISVRNYLSLSEQELKKKFKYKVASKLCDYIVAVSKAVELDQIKKYKIKPSKICTIPNYCNKEYIQQSIQKYDIDEKDKPIFENGKIIITVGKLKTQKGQWHLIRAFKEVVKNNTNAKLIILGMGELEEYFKKLIVDMHLENNVFILGHKNKNIYTYMAKSDIFVFPSLYEGMPNVVLEAMACGLPIIATDCYGGNKEIVAPNLPLDEDINKIEKCDYGILIPKLDTNKYGADNKLTKEEKMLADAINQMLEDSSLIEKYKEKSNQRINDFNQENYEQQWEKVINKKNIMVLVTKLSNGGAEKAALQLAENLSKTYNVYLTVFDNSIQDYETKVRVIDLKTKITHNAIIKAINSFKRIFKVKKIKKQYNINCTISFLTGPNLINVLSKKQDKTIVSIRNNIQRKTWIENKISNFVIKRADKVVTVAEKMREFYIQNNKINPNKITTIYNICNLEKIEETTKNTKMEEYKDIFENSKVIISLGRYISQKGHWHLIRAFSKIVKEDQKYKLVIFGRGNKKEYLQKLVNDLNLNDYVYLLDFVENPYIYLKHSDFFVLPSLYEGCANALLEAMACGLPVIATDCDYGNREILAPNIKEQQIKKYAKEEFGILVPALDEKYYTAKDSLTQEEQQLYNAIKELIENESLKKHYSEKSLERIKDFQDNTENWIKCIEKD